MCGEPCPTLGFFLGGAVLGLGRGLMCGDVGGGGLCVLVVWFGFVLWLWCSWFRCCV